MRLDDRLPKLLVVLAASLGVAAASTAHAQAPKRKQQRQTIRTDGKLQTAAPGMLQIVTEAGQPWLFKIDDGTREVSYTAAAKSSWLRPGLWVRFSGAFDKRGVAHSPISSIEVFTPSADQQIGVFSDNTAAAGGLFASDDAKTAPDKKMVMAKVAGRLTSLEKGEMEVAVGNAKIEAHLAENAAVSVDVADYRLARPGDTVAVSGWYYQQGQAWATQLTIRAAETLRGVEKKPRVIYSEQQRKQAITDLNSLKAGENAVFGEPE